MLEVEPLPGLAFWPQNLLEENLLQHFMEHIILIINLRNFITQQWLDQI